jgi:hypothetical protein
MKKSLSYEANRSSAIQKYLTFYEIWMLSTTFTKCRHLFLS